MDLFGDFCGATYSNYFGTWNQFLREIGERLLIDHGISKERLIASFYSLKEKLGHKPSAEEMDNNGAF